MYKLTAKNKQYFAGAGFPKIPGKYENVVFINKNPRNRNKCMKLICMDPTFFAMSRF